MDRKKLDLKGFTLVELVELLLMGRIRITGLEPRSVTELVWFPITKIRGRSLRGVAAPGLKDQYIQGI